MHDMKKIKFDNATIEAIREYAKTHTMSELCNRFTLKVDTMRRVCFENDIRWVLTPKSNDPKFMVYDDIDPQTIEAVCRMYKYTDTRIQDIALEFHLNNYVLQVILDRNFSQKFQDDRKSRIYRKSWVGRENWMTGRTGEAHPNYKGLVEDGHGYYMIIKPSWYTGRAKSEYVFYHTVVMCEALGLTELPAGFVIHHIDGNKKNNDISNLALINISGHSKLHMIQRNLSKEQRLSNKE